MDDFNRGLQRELDSIEVLQASCNGYYRTGSGRIVTQWPHRMSDLKRELEAADTHLVPEDLDLLDPAGSVAARRSPRGGSFASVAEQINELRARLR
jgi:argininosuccinate lyase